MVLLQYKRKRITPERKLPYAWKYPGTSDKKWMHTKCITQLSANCSKPINREKIVQYLPTPVCSVGVLVCLCVCVCVFICVCVGVCVWVSLWDWLCFVVTVFYSFLRIISSSITVCWHPSSCVDDKSWSCMISSNKISQPHAIELEFEGK